MNNVLYEGRLAYIQKPVKEQILFDETISLAKEGWPSDATFRLRLWEYENELPEENYREFREYGVGAQILRNIGLNKIILLTNNRKKVIGLDGFNIEIIKQEKF